MFNYPTLADFSEACPLAIEAVECNCCKSKEQAQALWVCEGFVRSQVPDTPTPAPATTTKATAPAMSDQDLVGHLKKCCPTPGQKTAAVASVPWAAMLAKLLSVLSQLFPA